jgi:hypothetical protein
LFEFNEESSTTDLFAKDRKSVDAVASYILKSPGKVEICPFASHCEVLLFLFFAGM